MFTFGGNKRNGGKGGFLECKNVLFLDMLASNKGIFTL